MTGIGANFSDLFWRHWLAPRMVVVEIYRRILGMTCCMLTDDMLEDAGNLADMLQGHARTGTIRPRAH